MPERPAEVTAGQAGEVVGERADIGRHGEIRVDPHQRGDHADDLSDNRRPVDAATAPVQPFAGGSAATATSYRRRAQQPSR